jgi:hypothetical protein
MEGDYVAFNQTFDICRQGEESVWAASEGIAKVSSGLFVCRYYMK